MPQNVRNWWVTVDIDGRQTPLASGPQSRFGGFQISIEQRGDDGEPFEALQLHGRVREFSTEDGKRLLELEITGENHDGTVLEFEPTYRKA